MTNVRLDSLLGVMAYNGDVQKYIGPQYMLSVRTKDSASADTHCTLNSITSICKSFILTSLFFKVNSLCFGMKVYINYLCTRAFLYVCYSFLLISNKFCDLSLLHWPLAQYVFFIRPCT